MKGFFYMAMRTSSKRKPVASGYSCKRRRKPWARTPRTMSRWQRWVLAVGIVLVFAAGFYTFFIRPYAYRWKPCYGQKGYGVCMPCRYEVHGVDVSHYQGVIDWKRVAADSLGDFPLRFAFLKASFVVYAEMRGGRPIFLSAQCLCAKVTCPLCSMWKRWVGGRPVS